MPQSSRTPYQRTVFRWMVKNVNALFLGGSILIVMDSAYLSKFWTQLEAWLGMQRCTLQGLKPASKASRWVTWSIHSAMSAAELEQRWMNKSPQEAEALLSKPDCVVTNMSDKTTQLKKLATLDQDVQRSWASIVRLCRETHDATKLLRAGLGREELAELGVFMGPGTEDFPTMRCVRNLVGHSHAVRCLALNSTSLFSGSDDTSIKEWDIQSGECRRAIKAHSDCVLCFALSSNSLFSGSYDNSIKEWDIQSGKCKRTIKAHSDCVTCLALSSTSLFSGCDDYSIKIWDVQSGECRRTIKAHSDWVTCLALSATSLFSRSDDGSIKEWRSPKKTAWTCWR